MARVHFAGILIVFSLSVGYHALAQDRRGVFLQSEPGEIVKNSYAECWRTSSWEEGMVVTECGGLLKLSLLTDTYFKFDRHQLSPDGQHRLDELVRRLAEYTIESVLIIGHTDSIGTHRYNQALSERRAAAVRVYLVHHGIPAQLIKSFGMGETQPIASNLGARGRAKNRRVEIEIKAEKKDEN